MLLAGAARLGLPVFVVTSAERAKDLKHAPVYISGVAEGHPYPADRRDVVGTVSEATLEQVDAACALARPWQEPPGSACWHRGAWAREWDRWT